MKLGVVFSVGTNAGLYVNLFSMFYVIMSISNVWLISNIQFISLPARRLEVVVNSHLPASIVLGLSFPVVLVPDFLPDLVEVAQCFLVVRGESERFFDLSQSLCEIVLFASLSTMLASAHPRAM